MLENNTQTETELNIKNNKKYKIILTVVGLVLLFLSFVYYIDYKKSQAYNSNSDGAATVASYYDINFNIKGFENLDDTDKSNIESIFSIDNYTNGEYFLTKIPSRAKKVYAHGNFSDDDNNANNDLAFLIEKNDFKSSRLIIISRNGEKIYSKDYDYELPTITSFMKGSKIYLDDSILEPSPSDGIMLHFKYSKKALLYIPNTKTFEEFHQHTKEELENTENDDESVDEREYATIDSSNGEEELKKEKSNESETVQKIAAGTEVEIIEAYVDEDWYKIKLNNGQEGYIKKENIK